MSAPSWLRRSSPEAAGSPSPTPYLAGSGARPPAVRPLFGNSPATQRAAVAEGTVASFDDEVTEEAKPTLAAAAPRQGHDGDAAARIGQALAALEELRLHVLEEARADAVELAIVLVRNLVGVIEGVSVDKLLEVAREALATAGPNSSAVMRVHPDDLAVMQAAALHSGEGTPVELRADAALGKGDIVVDTPAGRVDGSRRARLAQLERSVRTTIAATTSGSGRAEVGGKP